MLFALPFGINSVRIIAINIIRYRQRDTQMKTTIEQLNEKLDAMVSRYNTMKQENETLRNEVAVAKAQSEAKDTQIRKLEDENALKDIEIEDIVKKIESALG